MAAPSLRPRGSDDLGLKRALSDRLLPLLVAAMVFLAGLACAGAIAAADLAAHWRTGVTLVTVQVPLPLAASPSGGQRGEAVAAVLGGLPGAAMRRLGVAEVAGLLRPWLGDAGIISPSLLPAVFEVRAQATQADLAETLERVAPGTLLEHTLPWFERLTALANRLQGVAALVVLVVAFIAAAVVAVAARAGLAARRDAIEIVHGLGGTDRMVAGRFAGRMTWLAFCGAVLGAGLAVPVLLGLAKLAMAFQPVLPAAAEPAMLASLPTLLWISLSILPLLAAAIAWGTTQFTVRLWLGRLP